jgi:cell division protein ZapA (FtsZ GTPase activity inhibitor)
MVPNELRLDILGTSFTITTDAEEEYLEKVLSQYKAAVMNTQKISGISEPLNIAILTGFMLCDEFNKVKEKLDTLGKDKMEELGEAQEVEDRTIRLINKLEQALNLFSDDKNI